jgi:hypothetical protein
MVFPLIQMGTVNPKWYAEWILTLVGEVDIQGALAPMGQGLVPQFGEAQPTYGPQPQQSPQAQGPQGQMAQFSPAGILNANPQDMMGSLPQ